MRTGVLVAAVLAVLLVAGGVGAWAAGGRAAFGLAPRYSAPAVPHTGAGAATVLLSTDALGHPAAEAVRAQLQRHFDAINARDRASWVETVVPQRTEALPGPQWTAAYDSTTDGTIRVDRIDDLDGGRVLVRLRFVSTQDVADAPADLPARRICWRGSLPMTGTRRASR